MMTAIARFLVPEDAHLFRAYLASEGIESWVLDEHTIQLFWHYSNALGGVRVVVNDEDVEEAETIHAGYVAALRAKPVQDAEVRCWPLVLVISYLIGVPTLLFGRRRVEAGPDD